MNHRTLSLAAALAFAAAAPAPLAAQDDLGLGRMWTFHNPPLAYLEQEYGFAPDAEWWTQVQLASLRFGRGCSASFVSPRGLILTNHHCARGNIADVQGDNDWVRDGFVAGAYEEEVRLPGLTVQQLVRTTDVTAAMSQGVAVADDPEAAARRRAENRAQILARATADAPALQPQIVELFQGAQYFLYQYRIFDDIRLVMAPHLQAAHFGGDPDNFVYPRYAADFAFCRAYEDGEPADTSGTCFGWSAGPEPGELVILTGNPGSTKRLLTKAQLEHLRDARYPRVRALIDNRIAIMRAMAAADPAREKELRTRILSFENGQKLYRGEHAALSDEGFMARKAAAESAFRARVDGDDELRARYGELWDQLAEVAAERTALEGPVNFHSAGGSPHLLCALALLEFAGGDEAAGQRARDVRVTDDPLQQAFFVDHLERAGDWLPDQDPFLAAMLAGRSAADAAARLAATSQLGDGAFVAALVDGGADAIAASDDPALQVARVLQPLEQRARAAAAALDAREAALGARMGRAVFAVYGDDVTPDATFTLRFSDGRPQGYGYNGTLAPWRTVFHGMFARSAEFDGQYPFDLPEPWRLAVDRLDLRAPINFVCTVDSTGGNSGSPLIDRDRRIVGLLFDGNIESLGNEFFYSDANGERSVCVHPQGIVEALQKVYGAHRIADELRHR